MVTKFAFLTFLFLLLAGFVSAEYVSMDWNKTEPFQSNGVNGVDIDSQNNIYIAGDINLTSDFGFFIGKYDPNGNLLLNITHFGPADTDTVANDIVVDSANNMIATGIMSNATGAYRYLTVKYNSIGSHIWNATYNSSSGDSQANSVAVDSSNNVIVTGDSNGGDTAWQDYYTIKYNGSNGIPLWERRFDRGMIDPYSGDFAAGVAVDSQNNIIVTGYSDNGSFSLDFLTLKYDSSGNLLWNRTFKNGSDAYGLGVDTDSQDNIIVTGYNDNGADLDILTVKYDPSGNQIWNKTYDGGDSETSQSLIIDPSDSIIIAGSLFFSDYFYISKFNSSGNDMWSFNFSTGPNDDVAHDLAWDNNNKIVVGGWNGSAMSLIKYSIYNPMEGGNASNVSATGIAVLNITLAGSSNLSQSLTGVNQIEFKDVAEPVAPPVLNWSHDFSLGSIDLSKIVINKTADKIVFDLGNQLNPGDVHSFYLIDNGVGIYYCPYAKVLSTLSQSCSGLVAFTQAELQAGTQKIIASGASAGSYVNGSIEGAYYRITTNSTADDGGGGMTNAVPEFSDFTAIIALAIVAAGFFVMRNKRV